MHFEAICTYKSWLWKVGSTFSWKLKKIYHISKQLCKGRKLHIEKYKPFLFFLKKKKKLDYLNNELRKFETLVLPLPPFISSSLIPWFSEF